jgi:hypothetical protein
MRVILWTKMNDIGLLRSTNKGSNVIGTGKSGKKRSRKTIKISKATVFWLR